MCAQDGGERVSTDTRISQYLTHVLVFPCLNQRMYECADGCRRPNQQKAFKTAGAESSFWVCEQPDVRTRTQVTPAPTFLNRKQTHKNTGNVRCLAETLLAAHPHVHPPSLGADVLDFLPTLLQRLRENLHIFVRFDPNQLLREVDLKRFHCWKKQLFYRELLVLLLPSAHRPRSSDPPQSTTTF